MDLAVSREIAASAERVWDLLVDWERQSEWMLFTTVRSDGSGGVGTRLEALTAIGPFRVTDPMVVTEWVPPHRCVVLHQGRMLRGKGVFTIEILSVDWCRFSWREEAALPGPLAALTRPFFALALRRFADMIEHPTDG